MLLTEKEVSIIARLARIELTEEEIRRFQNELSAILDFVGKLNEVDTDGVYPMSGGTRVINAMREDREVSDLLEGESDTLLEQVPARRNRWVEVKSVFES